VHLLVKTAEIQSGLYSNQKVIYVGKMSINQQLQYVSCNLNC